MELRSRKNIGNSPESGGNEQGEADSKQHNGDDEIYLPSSDSEISSSSHECEIYEEKEVVDSNPRVKLKLSAGGREIGGSVVTLNDYAEPSAKRGRLEHAEQFNNEQQSVRLQGNDNNISWSNRRKKGRGKRKRKGDPPLLWEIWEDENEKWIDEHLTDDVDLDQQNGTITETADEPQDLMMPLLRYQKEWLAWALKQEGSEIKGGILADEMGMGKTIQAIALVLAKREIYRTIGEPNEPSSSSGMPGIITTLVICPVAAVTQWVNEINRFTSKGSMKVLVYHGSNREKSNKQFSENDFVITTYSTIEADYRKYMMPPKQKCPYCGKPFLKKQLTIHLKYFCGPGAIRTAKQSKQEKKKMKASTFTLDQDMESGKDGNSCFEDHMGMRYGKETSFEMDSSVGGVKNLSRGKSVLHSVKWQRIILDEAHSIKDRRSNTAKAVLALESSYKWALSGTPLQNRVGELYSLVRFLQITPYSYYFCKDCDCRVLDYSSTECPNCPHKSVRHFCWWNRNVATPIQVRGNVNEGKRAMILLKHKLLKNIVLRRTKKGRAADLALPPRIISLRRDSLDIKEADYYFSLYNESQAQFNTYIQAGTLMNNYAHIFDLLTRLRQAVDHPYLVVYSRTAALRGAIEAETEDVQQICGVCATSSVASGSESLSSMDKGMNESLGQPESTDTKEFKSNERKFREFIYGEEALRISPTEPYCLHRPIRRGHFNVSQHYPVQQVLEDLYAIWDWILTDKLHIPLSERNLYSAILVVPETFDNREIKEMLSIVLRDLRFSSAVVHQEGLAAVFGNGLSTACIVNMGAQVTSIICLEDGVALPISEKTLPFGGEDISRCFLWTQRHHQTWPQIRTDILTKPMDLIMLNKLKESYCEIKEGEVDTVAVVHSYEDGMPAGSHKTRLTALNVSPMGLFYPKLLVPDVYPPPPRSWYNDYEDMLEDTWHTEFPRRSDMSDGLYPSINVGLSMWDSYPVLPNKPKKEEKVGLAEAITSSILATGRIDLQRKLFCSIQLIGGVALTGGLIPVVEERVLHAIPSNEAIDMVEVLQSRTNPTFVSWKGGAILGILDPGRDAWIHREDWIRNGIHIGSGRKYKDSYFLQAQPMCYINS